jgi:NAD(P)-dependent dehydrogenase (short-subunit alcohol dehydrogenase family)
MNSLAIEASHFDFSGKRVLVTGAAGGIGSELARAFGAHEGHLLLADRNQAGLVALQDELQALAVTVEVIEYDQSDSASIEDLVASAGHVDILLNNAGILRTGNLLEASFAEARDVIETNLLGPIQLAMAVGAGMVSRQSGVIINTASQLAFTGAATRALYASAKAGLVQFTRSAAAEWGPHGVRVVALAPGRTLTPLNKHLLDDPEELEASLKRIPARRIGDAREMARLALVLASPLCDYVVGETLIADGGYILE